MKYFFFIPILPVQAKREEILPLLADMNDKQERVNLVKSYVSNPNPAVYTSEYRGVSWHKALKKWKAKMSITCVISGKKTIVDVHLGVFVNELEAKYVYDSVNFHRTVIRSLLKDINDSEKRTTLVKSYIPKHIDIDC